jgi:hypothetical protein
MEIRTLEQYGDQFRDFEPILPGESPLCVGQLQSHRVICPFQLEDTMNLDGCGNLCGKLRREQLYSLLF